MIIAIALCGECFATEKEARVAGSKVLDLISSLGFPLGTCFISESNAQHKSACRKSRNKRSRA